MNELVERLAHGTLPGNQGDLRLSPATLRAWMSQPGSDLIGIVFPYERVSLMRSERSGAKRRLTRQLVTSRRCGSMLARHGAHTQQLTLAGTVSLSPQELAH